MKRISMIILTITMCCFISCTTLDTEQDELQDFDKAYDTASSFVDNINRADASNTYDLLISEYTNQITKDDFIYNFNNERTYNYLVPLYMYIKSIDVSDDGLSADVVCSVAARLPGQIFTFSLHKENGIYKVDSLKPIVDGSYVKIFDDVVTLEGTRNL